MPSAWLLSACPASLRREVSPSQLKTPSCTVHTCKPIRFFSSAAVGNTCDSLWFLAEASFVSTPPPATALLSSSIAGASVSCCHALPCYSCSPARSLFAQPAWFPMSQDGIEVVQVPRDVHDDFLMSYLLLRAVVNLCERDTGTPPPANLGMLAWNDLLAWAQNKFRDDTLKVLFEYATALDRSFVTNCSSAVPILGRSDDQQACGAPGTACA